MVGAGIQVIPSKPGLKIHGKAALIVHKKVQKDGQQKAYAYISTGNFNEITSQQYSDLGFFTSDRAIIDDLKKLFTHLEKPQGVIEFSQLIIPKYNFTNSIKELIDNEIENAKNGEQAYILIKINNLDDKKIIDQLYLASLSGVKIDLIVRSICCLVPGQAYSQNIRVIRIVDKYLEHSRVFLFHNSGKSAIYLSSADMMKSNLKRRIDVIVPIHSEKLKAEIIETLKIQLSDNTKARILGRNIHEWTVPNKNEIKIRSQIEIYHYLKSVYQ
jgi:polyphosphate kinase